MRERWEGGGWLMRIAIPAAALNQHIAILGKTGSGKTYAAKGIVEHLLDMKRQVCVVDPTGAWWGLRLDADGKRKGFDVVLLGGKHADIPLAERSGAGVARLVTQQRASVVIDTSGLTVGEYTRWFTDFAGTLYTTIREPLHLVIDEAHCYMPQGKVPDPQAGKMLHAGNRLMSGGRSLGIRATLITQRPAKLHKDSLTCADTLIAMRVIAPQDVGAIADWIKSCGDSKQGKAVVDSLAQLPRGEGWVWYPEGGHLKRVQFPAIETYDSSATPKHGAGAGPSVSEIDLGEVRSALADAVAEAEANDPKLLRAKIADLQSKLRGTKPATDDKAIERAVVARDREWDTQIAVLIKRTDGFIGRLRKIGELAHLNGETKVMSVESPARTASTTKPIPRRPLKAISGTLAARPQRFLDAAAALTRLGAECSRVTVCAWVGVSPSTGSAADELRGLVDAGLITLNRGAIGVTEAGQAAAGHLDPQEAIERAKSALSPRQRKFFDAIVAAHPKSMTRQDIADKFGLSVSTGSLSDDLRTLRNRGLIDIEHGSLRARDFLFVGVSDD